MKNIKLLKRILTESTSVKPKVWSFGEGNPKILITAGIHGDEPTSIYIAFNLIRLFEEMNISGSVQVIPIVNPLAFMSRERGSIDKKDMNRVFPGKEDGTITERIAFEVWNIAKNVDYVIDLHCCGRDGSTYGLALHKNHSHSKAFVNNFPLDVCVQSHGTKGQLFIECSNKNIPGFIIEIEGGGPSGYCPLYVVKEVQETILFGLKELQIISKESIQGKSNKSVQFVHEIEQINSPSTGFFSPLTSSGKFAKKSDIFGMMNNEIELFIPEDSRVISIVPEKFTFKGEPLLHYAKLQKD